jgi:hypothetical protein
LPQIQRILQEFEKQSEIMDMKEEMMNDAIDDAMEDEGDEEERYFPAMLPCFIHIYIEHPFTDMWWRACFKLLYFPWNFCH